MHAKIIELESLRSFSGCQGSTAYHNILVSLTGKEWWIFQELWPHEQRETTQMTSSRIELFPAFDASGCDWLLLIETRRLNDKRK